MFINFCLNDEGQLFVGTVNTNNLIMIGFEKIDVPFEDGTQENVYRLVLKFNDIEDYELFETLGLDRMHAVHSAFCSVLAGGDTIFPEGNIGFIEPIYPPEAGTLRTPEMPKDESRRTLSDI